MVSPRKSRRKSACFSRTRTSIPARANRYPSIIPAGPPPTMQHVPGDKGAASIFSISWLRGSLAVVVQRVVGVSRTFDARNSAQIFVDRPDVVVRHVLKTGPRHDLQKVAVKWRRKAPAVWNACAG